MGQANVEYAEWLEHNPPARNPVGWLLICAERRAKNLLDMETRRPSSAPLDEVFDLADPSTPTPEQQALDQDRHDRLRKALGFLPEKECKLLALVYFEDYSIREAGRKLGWQKSAADRHHNRALKKLRALVGDDRSLLSPATLGLVAWLAVYGERGWWRRAIDAVLTPGREGLALGLEVGEWIGRQLGELGRRLSPITDQASAAASGGSGRLVGACGVAVASVVCGIAASGIAPGGAGVAIGPARPAGAPAGAEQAVPVPTRTPSLPTPELPPPEPTPPSAQSAKQKPTQAITASSTPTPKARQKTTPKAPLATPQQTAEEFGIEGGTSPAPEPEVTPTPQAPQLSPSRSGSSGSSSSGSSSGSQVTREFGLE
jgi:RNA polymerase sigma factor (sigma-70 family)